MNFCEQCGATLGSTARFCSACGHAVAVFQPPRATPFCAKCGQNKGSIGRELCQECLAKLGNLPTLLSPQPFIDDRTTDAAQRRGWLAMPTCLIPFLLMMYSAITEPHENRPVLNANAEMIGRLLVFIGFVFLLSFFILGISAVNGNSRSAGIARIIAICGASTYALVVLSVYTAFGQYDLSWKDLIYFGFPAAFPFVSDAMPE
jgi:hypothetical protein